MIKRWIFLLLALPLFIGSTGINTKVNFYKGNLTKAKEIAAAEGKLYFVDFMANWCMPCRWMDETTFSDPTVAKYIKENYIAVKVDIDDFDGYAYKQMYNIKLLPSILIFNAKGEIVAQYEESLPPSKLLKILQKYNTPENRVGNRRPLPLIRESKPEPTINSQHSRPSLKPEPTIQPTPNPVIQPAAAPQATIPTKTETPSYNAPLTPTTRTNTAHKPVINPSNQGLYRFKVSRQATQGFSVQIGVYGQYGNVLREAAKFEELFNQPVIVHIGHLNGKTVYKVMIGEFGSRDAATNYREKMRQKKIDGIVKDLSVIG